MLCWLVCGAWSLPTLLGCSQIERTVRVLDDQPFARGAFKEVWHAEMADGRPVVLVKPHEKALKRLMLAGESNDKLFSKKKNS